MFISRSLLISLVATPLLALAQSGSDANPFKVPQGGYTNVSAGSPLTLQWTPTTSGTVSLILRSGASSNLVQGSVIASNITNSGSYTWSIPLSTERESDYTVEIVDDSDPTQYNFTPYIYIDSLVTTASTTASTVTLGAVTSLPVSSTISHTGSSVSASTTGSSSSGTASSSGSMTTSMSSTAASTATTTSAGPVSTGAGSRATAAVGMLGALALGALAL